MSAVALFGVLCCLALPQAGQAEDPHIFEFEETDTSIYYYEPETPDEDAAVLILLHGYYPGVNIDGYHYIAKQLSKKGIHTILPKYLKAREDSFENYSEWAEFFDLFMNGYSSWEKANEISSALKAVFKNQLLHLAHRPRVLFGHSLGGRIGAAVSQLGTYSGIILSGTGDHPLPKDLNRLCFDIDENPDPQTVITLEEDRFPYLTIINGEDDPKFGPVSERAFSCIPAKRKQHLVLKGYVDKYGERVPADHFEDISNNPKYGPVNGIRFREAIRRISDVFAENLIHHYSITLGWDSYDGYVFSPMLINLAKAHSDVESEEQIQAWNGLYGEHLTYEIEDQVVVVRESSQPRLDEF